MSNTNRVQRLTFLIGSTVGAIGIFLSGYNQVHWFMYVLPGGLLFAAITGICPGFAVSKFLLGEKHKAPATSS